MQSIMTPRPAVSLLGVCFRGAIARYGEDALGGKTLQTRGLAAPQ